MACAGPKISPRNECAIITWSRTSSVNMGSLVIDALTEDSAAGREDAWQRSGQVGELHRGRQQCVEAGVGEQGERGGEAARMRPARAMRWRNASDLARDQGEAAAMERAAERQRHVAGAIPGELHHACLVAGAAKRRGEPGTAAAR